MLIQYEPHIQSSSPVVRSNLDSLSHPRLRSLDHVSYDAVEGLDQPTVGTIWSCGLWALRLRVWLGDPRQLQVPVPKSLMFWYRDGSDVEPLEARPGCRYSLFRSYLEVQGSYNRAIAAVMSHL